MDAGFASVPLELSGLPAGLYVVRVTAGAEPAVQTITVVR